MSSFFSPSASSSSGCCEEDFSIHCSMSADRKNLHGLFSPVTPWPFPPGFVCVCRGGPPDTFLVQWTVALFKFIVPRSPPPPPPPPSPHSLSAFVALPPPLFLQDEGKKSPFLPLFDPLSPPPLLLPGWRWRVFRETPFVLIAFHPRGLRNFFPFSSFFLPFVVSSFLREIVVIAEGGREGGNDRCFFSIPYSSSLPQKNPFHISHAGERRGGRPRENKDGDQY